MKRIVAFVQPIDAGIAYHDVNAPHAVEAHRTDKEVGGPPPFSATDTGELKIEAFLSDGRAQQIVDSLLERDTGSQIDSIIDDLIYASLERAGPDACDLYDRIVVAVNDKLISRVYAECDHIKTKASARLGINRNTFHNKLKEHHRLLDDEQH